MAASDQTKPKVCVVQDGARLHYAVPLALQRAGALERVYTDWYAAGRVERVFSALLAPIGGGQLKRMRERVAPELDASRVYSRPSLALLRLRRARYKSGDDYYAMVRRQTAHWITAAGFGRANGVFGFVRNIDPAVCEAAKARGLKVVVDQMIAPHEIELAEAAKQRERFPGWGDEPADSSAQTLIATERRTWELADAITCASDYVRDGLVSCGVPAGRIAVLPYPFDSRSITPPDRRERTGPLTVGFVGSVSTRKGVPYLLQLARRFDPAKARFVLVGPVAIPRDKLAGCPAEIVGPVPRSDVSAWLERFDVFCLPSTCEGSAGAVAEAMAAGLPVIVSPNTGAPITDGVEGFITPYDDIEAMQRRIEMLLDAPKRHEMGLAARRRIETFDMDYYGRALVELFGHS